MKKFLLIFVTVFILLNKVHSLPPADLLTSVQSGLCSLSSITGATPYLLQLSGNNFFITFSTPFIPVPSVALALNQFSSSISQRYQIQVSLGLTNTTGFQISFGVQQNLWNSISYNWIASIANSIIVGSFNPTNFPSQSNTSSPLTFAEILPNTIVNSDQSSVKFDIFLNSFDLSPPTTSNQFRLIVSINYNSSDLANSLYSTYNDYVFALSNGYLVNPYGSVQSISNSTTNVSTSTTIVTSPFSITTTSSNNSNITSSLAPGTPIGTTIISSANATSSATGSVFSSSGSSATSQASSVYPSEFFLSLSFLGNLNFLSLTYISHPVIVNPSSTIQLTTGFNTFAISSSSVSNTGNLFSSNNNKNNLGSINCASFYGFTGIDLIGVSSLDASISLQYSYSATLTSGGSTINTLTSSYYFYELFALTINNNQLDSLPISGITWSGGSLTSSSSIINSYYTITSTGSAVVLTSSSISVIPSKNYLLTIQVLDIQGCWANSGFVSSNIAIGATTGSSTPSVTFTTAYSGTSSNYFVNPNGGCVSSTSTQFSTPIQRMFRFYTYNLVTTGNSLIFTITLNGSTTLYIKNLNIYLVSTNQIIDPNIYESTYSALTSFYNFQVSVGTLVSSSYSFFSPITSSSPSNAISFNIQNNLPISFNPFNSFSLVNGKTYTINLYILDSAGNLASSFASPTLQIRLNGNIIFSQTATLSNPFTTSSFSSTSVLTTPIDSLYLLITTNFIPTSPNSNLLFTLKDLSNSNHVYWIRGITLISVLVFDPVSRQNFPACPANSYLNTQTQPPACQSCSIQGKVSSSSGCVCPASTYLDPVTNLCFNCLYSCNTCAVGSLSTCLTCLPNRSLSISNLCLCNPGFVEVNKICVSCIASCATCAITPSTCASCTNGRTLTGATCACPANTYDDGIHAQCINCPINCLTCVLINNAVACTSCYTSTTIHRSYTVINNNCPCSDGSIQNIPMTLQCQPCYYACATCNGPTKNDCLSCPVGSNRSLYPSTTGSSICQCAIGYADLGMPTCTLVSCTFTYACTNCTNNVCSQCDSSLYRILNTVTYQCNCMPGYFQNSNNICTACSLGCTVCNSSASCTNCYSGASLSNAGVCSCLNGYYPNISSQTCSQCPSSCLTCSSFINCLTCANSLSLINGNCLCPTGKYLLLGSCENCPLYSYSCDANGNILLCLQNYYLYNSSCLSVCPLGTYQSDKSCINCPLGCLSCTGPTTCLNCTSQLVLSNGACILNCPPKTYLSNNICLNCDITCASCNQNSTTCTSCPNTPTKTYLSGSICVPNCPTGTTIINGACIFCNPTCLSCLGTIDTCTSCSSTTYLYLNNQTCVTYCPTNTYLVNNKCYNNCPSGYYINGTTCSQCNPNCDQCVNSTFCTSCPNQKYLYNGICNDTCPNGTILIQNTCQKCPAYCNTCSNSNNCTNCMTGYQLNLAGVCVPVCTGSTYFNGVSCLPCPNGCLLCQSNSICIKCVNPIAIIENGKCFSCISPCATCTDSSINTCTSCLVPFGLSNNNCVLNCPYGQKIINGVCLCESGNIYNGSCTNLCPYGTTNIGNQCKVCNANCASCISDVNKCTSCLIGYILVGNDCILDTNCPYGQTISCSGKCLNICPQNTLYRDGFCVETCPHGQTPNSQHTGCIKSNSHFQSQQCHHGVQECPQNCIKCFEDVCTTCELGYFLKNNLCIPQNICSNGLISFKSECVTNCPNGTYQSGNHCNLICSPGYFYYKVKNLCYFPNCPQNTILRDYICE